VDACEDAGIVNFQNSLREAWESSPHSRDPFGIDQESCVIAEKMGEQRSG